MSLKQYWPWCKGGGDGEGQPRTIGPIFGYIMLVNMCLGTGFLGVPYSFFYAGYLAAIPTLLFIAFLSWLNCSWLLEVMARAQAVESLDKSRREERESSTDKLGEKVVVVSTNTSEHCPPDFRITMDRKFEMVELCEIFGAKWLKYIYLVVLSLICFVGLWAFSTVAGSAWSSNIPFNFGGMTMCGNDAFHHQVLPVHSTGCLRSYYFSLFLFGVFVIFLSLIGLKELSWVQLFMGFLRFLTVGGVILYSIVRLAGGGDGCADNNSAESAHNLTINATADYVDNITNGTDILPFKDVVVKFNFKGWLGTVSVFCYAFIIHFGVASLTHPVKEKKHMPWMTAGMFITALISYMGLGIVAPLWFKASVQETVTLNFNYLSKPGNSAGLRTLAYYLIFFPSIDVMSAYPLVVHCMVSNIYIIITGNDTSQPGKWRFDWILRLALRLLGSITPLLAAMGMANLIYVMMYGGLSGFIVCYFFPAILQLSSIYSCRKKFSTSKKGHIEKERHTNTAPSDVKGTECSCYTNSDEETTPLLSNGRSKGHPYMTPFSIPFLSHPWFVGFMTVVVVVIFVLIVTSLFVHPDKLSCSSS